MDGNFRKINLNLFNFQDDLRNISVHMEIFFQIFLLLLLMIKILEDIYQEHVEDLFIDL